MKIGILGSTGQAGKSIARKVLSEKAGTPVLFGRDSAKLESLRHSLQPFASAPLKTEVLDLVDQKSLEKAFRRIDFLVIALSSSEHLPVIVSAVLNTGICCLDILLGSREKREFLESHEQHFKDHGVCCITDGGYHPGIPGVMARRAEELSPGLHSVDIFGSFGLNWREKRFSPETMIDFVRELKRMDISVLKDGQWQTGWKNIKRFDFCDGRGRKDCVAMGMDEMQLLARHIPSLRNAGFYIAGFGWTIDWSIMPLSLAALALFPASERHIAGFLVWGLRTFGYHGAWAELRLAGEGKSGSIKMEASYPDPYDFTALPVVACIRQFADTPRRPGLWRQALYLDPSRFWNDMQDMGVRLSVTVRP
jgi:hypothetical protein